MTKPATNKQIAGISFTDDGVISPWRTRNDALRSLIARIWLEVEVLDQMNDNCKILNDDNDSLDAKVERLRAALVEVRGRCRPVPSSARITPRQIISGIDDIARAVLDTGDKR